MALAFLPYSEALYPRREALNVLGPWLILLLPVTSACSGSAPRASECRLPPLSHEEVAEIADAYLKANGGNDKFRKGAQRRITERDCRYSYEEAELLDSFGINIIVVIDRKRRVLDSYSEH